MVHFYHFPLRGTVWGGDVVNQFLLLGDQAGDPCFPLNLASPILECYLGVPHVPSALQQVLPVLYLPRSRVLCYLGVPHVPSALQQVLPVLYLSRSRVLQGKCVSYSLAVQIDVLYL